MSISADNVCELQPDAEKLGAKRRGRLRCPHRDSVLDNGLECGSSGGFEHRPLTEIVCASGALILDSGGHVLIGQDHRIRQEIHELLAAHATGLPEHG